MSSDPVLVGMASIPERAESMLRAVASLASQADRVVVALNEYDAVPEGLARFANVEAVLMDGSGGDAEKFAAVDAWDGFVVTVDDDVLYPSDYVATLVGGIDRYGRGTVVGFHGGKTLGWNGSAVAATHKRIRCLGALAEDDTDVNVLGTGALAFHAAHVPVWRDVFRHANMADVHMACHARTIGAPMVALAHDAGWLKDICPPGRSIYEANARGDGSQLDTTERRRQELARFDWTTAGPPRPRVRVSIATCQRPHLLQALLDDLARESRWAELEVAVFEDPSASDYSDTRVQVAERGWEWHRMPRRLGKQEHWRLVTRELEACRDSGADWFVFLPDDVTLVRHAIPRAIETWSRLDDPATLTLWRLKDHEGQTNWTGRLPVESGAAWEVFHVDGIYLCRRETLDFMGFACPAPSRQRLTSSGVGRAMSIRLFAAGRRMYRVDRSLAIPVKGEPSVMNPSVRDRRFPGVAL